MSKIPFEDWLYNRLSTHESPLDLDAEWKAFEPMLDKRKPGRKIALWWWTGGIAVFVVLISLWYMRQTPAAIQINKSSGQPQRSAPNENVLAHRPENKKMTPSGSHRLPTAHFSGSKNQAPNKKPLQTAHIIADKNAHKSAMHSLQTHSLTISYHKKNQINIFQKTGGISIMNPSYSGISSSKNAAFTPKKYPGLVPLGIYDYLQLAPCTQKALPAPVKVKEMKRKNISFFSAEAFAGFYKRRIHPATVDAEAYIRERNNTEKTLEALALECSYNRQIFHSRWYLSMGAGINQDAYWLSQNFVDTLDKAFSHQPTELTISSDYSRAVTKYGKVDGKEIYYVHRRIAGYRRIFYIPISLTYRSSIGPKGVLDLGLAAAWGGKAVFSGQRVDYPEHNIWTVEYEKTVQKHAFYSHYSFDVRYNYKLLRNMEVFAGMRFQQEYNGDRGSKYKWTEKRKYFYFNTGINVYL